MVDRLLASQHYGEKWARHWLDLARFAESHGFEHDYDRPTAYHYRDFVIKALNQDLPYDTFAKWQIAGDEFAPDDPLALMATGFLAAGVHSTQITKNEVEKHRYDELDDMLGNIGTTMLGLTVGCARCHDHKFDPIPARDYYRMLSAFTTTVRSEVELDLDPEGYKKAKAAVRRASTSRSRTRWRSTRRTNCPASSRRGRRPAATSRCRSTGCCRRSIQTKSAGGATFTKQPDGSVLVGGKNPTTETITLQVETDLTGIRSLRLEALAAPVAGEGRAGPGGERQLRAQRPQGDGPAEGQEGPARRGREARRTRGRRSSRRGSAVAAAIDGDAVTSGWAIDPQFGKDHAAAFDVREAGRLRGRHGADGHAGVQQQHRPRHRPAADLASRPPRSPT